MNRNPAAGMSPGGAKIKHRKYLNETQIQCNCK